MQILSPKHHHPGVKQVTFSLALFPNTFASLLEAPRADGAIGAISHRKSEANDFTQHKLKPPTRKRHLESEPHTCHPDIWQAYKPWTSTSSVFHVSKKWYQNTPHTVEPCQLKKNIPILPEKSCMLEMFLPEKVWADTLPETNIAPRNRPSQKESSIPTIHFQVLC